VVTACNRIALTCIFFSIGLVMSACSTPDPTETALGLADALNDLSIKQVLFNIKEILDNPYAVPAQMVPTTAAATNSSFIQPTLNIPLAPATTGVETVTKAATATATQNALADNNGLLTGDIAKNSANTVTNTGSKNFTSAYGSPTLGVTGNLTWSATWTIDPIVDPDALRRARALYRYAIGAIKTEAEFLAEYPVQRQLDDSIDETYTRLPGCVLCRLPQSNDLRVNPNISSGWISNKEFDGSISLKKYGYDNLYVRAADGLKQLSELQLYLFDALSTQYNSKFPSAKSKTFGIVTGNK
jgi:hypothetical protein